jgi:hypothetical protein
MLSFEHNSPRINVAFSLDAVDIPDPGQARVKRVLGWLADQRFQGLAEVVAQERVFASRQRRLWRFGWSVQESQ